MSDLASPPSKFSYPRLPNWPIRLAKYITQTKRTNTRLDWVNKMCVTWAAGCVEAITNIYPYEFTGINSPAKAAKAIKDAGFNNFEEMVRSRFYEVSKAQAMRGDICLVKAEPSRIFDVEVIPVAVGIVEPPFFWAIGEEGLGKGLLSDEAVVACFMIDDYAVRFPATPVTLEESE